MPITIRPARPEDYPAISRLLIQIATLHHELRPDLYCAVRKYDQVQYEAALENASTPILVVINTQGDVLGYAMCEVKQLCGIPQMVDHDYLWLDDLCVDESARGQGVGELLMKAVTDLAHELGLNKISLNVVEANEGARRFYERLGYTTQRRGMEIKLEEK